MKKSERPNCILLTVVSVFFVCSLFVPNSKLYIYGTTVWVLTVAYSFYKVLKEKNSTMSGFSVGQEVGDSEFEKMSIYLIILPLSALGMLTVVIMILVEFMK